MDQKIVIANTKSDQATKIPSVFQISGRYMCSSHADVKQKHFGGFCCIQAFVTSMFVMLSSEDKLGYNKGILALGATLFIMRSGCIYNRAFLFTRKQKTVFCRPKIGTGHKQKTSQLLFLQGNSPWVVTLHRVINPYRVNKGGRGIG